MLLFLPPEIRQVSFSSAPFEKVGANANRREEESATKGEDLPVMSQRRQTTLITSQSYACHKRMS